MNKLTIASIMLVVSASASADSGPGCGIGTMLFEGKTGTFSHVLAATTNGSYGNQTFGMTSGTLGCDTSQSIQVATLYMDSNFDKVAADISKGDGEALSALSELIGVDAKDKALFNALLKDNFTLVFPSDKTTANQAIENIVELMKQDAALKKYLAS